MPVCVMVMADAPAAEGLTQRLRDTELPLLKCLTIPPDGDAIDKVALLNPTLTRQQRQRGMARWLMPFGFLAGAKAGEGGEGGDLGEGDPCQETEGNQPAGHTALALVAREVWV